MPRSSISETRPTHFAITFENLTSHSSEWPGQPLEHNPSDLSRGQRRRTASRRDGHVPLCTRTSCGLGARPRLLGTSGNPVAVASLPLQAQLDGERPWHAFNGSPTVDKHDHRSSKLTNTFTLHYCIKILTFRVLLFL